MLQGPRTPSSSSPYRPHTSSPLSESCFSPSPSTSAAAKLQSRRLAQYKSTTNTPTRRVSSAYRSSTGHTVGETAASDEPCFAVRLFSSSVGGGGDVPREAENPRSALLRDRLRQRCVHRAQQARTKRVERERRRNALSSDGEDLSMESDEDDDQEVMINDEVCRRIAPNSSYEAKYSSSCFIESFRVHSINSDIHIGFRFRTRLAHHSTPIWRTLPNGNVNYKVQSLATAPTNVFFGG